MTSIRGRPFVIVPMCVETCRHAFVRTGALFWNCICAMLRRPRTLRYVLKLRLVGMTVVLAVFD